MPPKQASKPVLQQPGGKKQTPVYKVKTLLFEHDDCWSAQCLEYDIATQAGSLELLVNEVQRMLLAYVATAREDGHEPFQGIGKAPLRYWRLFDQSKLPLGAPIGLFRAEGGKAGNPPIQPEFRVAQKAA